MGATSLSDVQRLFAEAIRRPHPFDRLDAAGASSLVAPSHRGMTPAERLEVYRDQYWIRHRSNLGDDFPTLGWAVGAAMPALVSAYLETHPPRTWDLQRLGADMPRFVADDARWATLPDAVDAARLDWAFMDIFDAADAPPLDSAIVASVPEEAWPSAKLVLQPALRLLVLARPLHDLRGALKRGEPLPDLPAADDPVHLAVWRDAACFLRAMPLEPAAHALLSALAEGAPLGDACALVAALPGAPDVEASVGRWFQEWTERAWIARVELSASSLLATASAPAP